MTRLFAVSPFTPSRREGAACLTAAFALSCLLVFPCGPGGVARAAETDPREIKADMLYNIAKFIKWPDASYAHTEGQLVFTILGDDALAEALAATLSTKTINGHPVFVRVVRRIQDATGSQILYIAASESNRLSEVLKAVEGSPALTVADSSGFVALGGMVDFSDANERIRFEINQARAERAGLKISAKLLALARVVDAAP
jgi:hypothetical protein